jgi:hypothetical protein
MIEININIMNANIKTKNFGLNPMMISLILCMFIVVFPASAQKNKKDKVIAVSMTTPTNEKEKVFAPDGVELPEWFDDWKIKYNVHYIPEADLILYERPYSPERTVYDENIEHVIQMNNSVSSIENIECNENETLVTLKTNIYHSWNWLFCDKETCLIDTLTGDKYMLRDIQGAHEPGRLAVVHGLQGRAILQTLVFPPLKKTVTVVDFYEPDNFKDTPLVSTNVGGHREYGIALSKFTKQKKYPNAKVIY